MTKVLITGATGLVGSALLPLFGSEDEVHVLARGPLPGGVQGNVHVHQLDLANPINTSALPAEIDAVIYLAQSENFREFPDKALDIFDVNVASLMRLLDHGRRAGAKSFVYASSGGVYGSVSAPATEDVPVAASGGNGFYLSTKLCGEVLVESYAPFMSVIVLRLFFAYGAAQRRSMLIPRLVDNVRSGTPIMLQDRDGISINPIHAADAAAACKAALEVQGAHKINVAGPDVMSLRQICEMIGAKVGRAPQFEPGATGGSDVVADITAMTRLLGPPLRRLRDHLDELI